MILEMFPGFRKPFPKTVKNRVIRIRIKNVEKSYCELVHHHSQHQNDAQNHHHRVGINPCKGKAVADRVNHQRPDDRAWYAALAPRQQVTSQHGRHHRLKLQAVPGRGLGAVQPQEHEQGRDAR